MFALTMSSFLVLAMPLTVMADNEPNDDFANAETIYDSESEFGDLDASSDVNDYYKMFINSGMDVVISLSLTGSGFDFDLYLYNPSRTQVGSATTGSSFEYLIYETTSSGYYYINVRAISGAGDYMLTVMASSDSTPPVTDGTFNRATPESVPWSVGDYAASGGYLDLGAVIDKFKTEMTQDMSDDIKVSVSGSGGIGQYMIVEYAGLDGAKYKFDYSCRIYVAAEVSGKMTADDVDGYDGKASGKADVTADLLYKGSLWLGYYENPAKTKAYWAAEKMTLNIEASLDLSASVDLAISAGGYSMTGSADASAEADMDLQLTLEAEPGIPFMPAMDKDLAVSKTCVVSYSGSGSFDLVADLTATGYIKTMMGDDFEMPDSVHFDGSVSGTFTDYYSLYYYETTNKATGPAILNGGWAMVQNVDEMGLSDIGTRAEGFETEATYDPAKGMYTTYEPYLGPAGDMMDDYSDTDALDMTLAPASKEDAESFNDDPVAFLEAEGVSMPGSGVTGLLILLVLVVIVVVVVVVVVVMMTKKKAPPQQYPQPMYQQPPPPPQQYPPQDQYGQYPPQQGEYPPPPGQ